MQINLFDGAKQFINNKPIRLIELFGGISAQATALHELDVEFEHYRYVDFDKYSVKSTNAMYGTNWGATDITKINASDLGVVETDKYCYIMTYSFPCQDLSLAGKGAGMVKGSDTRSGLLWEVERLLNGMAELPQVLLMENVPQVHGKGNIESFSKWIEFLESKGYKNYWQDLKATDFGIPQSRTRTFMVSILGDYYYSFPKPIGLKYLLKDLLETEVDEKYYLSDKALNGKINSNFGSNNLESIMPKNGITPTLMARDYKDPKVVGISKTIGTGGRGSLDRHSWDIVKEPFMYNPYNKTEIKDIAPTQTTSCVSQNSSATVLICEPKLKELTKNQSQGNRVYDPNGLSVGLTANGGGLGAKTGLYQVPRGNNKGGVSYKEECPTITTSCFESNTMVVEPKTKLQDYRIRKLTPLECWKLMSFRPELFRKAEKVNSNAQLYKQAGNSICVNVLMAIFGELLGIEWQPKVERLIEILKERK